MLKVTVEDCLRGENNRFHLVLAAAKRARQLATGHQPLIPSEGDKPTVIAMREIKAGKTSISSLLGNAAHPGGETS